MRWEYERAVQLAPIMIIGILVDEVSDKAAIEIGVSMSIAVFPLYSIIISGIENCVDNDCRSWKDNEFAKNLFIYLYRFGT